MHMTRETEKKKKEKKEGPNVALLSSLSCIIFSPQFQFKKRKTTNHNDNSNACLFCWVSFSR